MATSPVHRGWLRDIHNGRLAAVYNGTEIFDFDANDFAIAIATAVTGGLQVVSGTLNVDGIADFALDVKFNSTITAGADGVGADGEQLTSGGAGAECDWAAAACLREYKNIQGERTDAQEVLSQMVATPVYDFQYKSQDESDEHVISTGDRITKYTGIMADDAPWATHYKGRILNPVNTFGYTVLAIRALNEKLAKLEAKVK